MTPLQLKKQIKKIPAKSGIYLFKGADDKPLYIGKALDLKSRTSHYLKIDNPRLKRMIAEAKKLQFIETSNDIEALILESQYIKKHKPDFNILLRDDKQYFYVSFSTETFPKIFLTHQPFSFTEFVGPFTDGLAIKTTLRLLRKIFPYCTCKQTHHNYCLNYHIGKCLGFCCLKDSPKPSQGITEKTYKKNVGAIKDILQGNKSSLIKHFEKEMKVLSDNQEYEKAIELQYKIEKLKKVFQNAQIIQHQTTINNMDILEKLKGILGLPEIPRRIEAYDIAHIQGKYAVGAMIVFTNSQPDSDEYRKFKIYTKHTPDDTKMLREILSRRLNHPEWPYPDLILIDGGKTQLNAGKTVVKNIPVIALTKNEKHIGHKITLEHNKELPLSKLPANVRNLLLRINSEAHRFAISYYRRLHRKDLKFVI